MPRTYSRRAALGVLGAGLAALTGATRRPSCAPITRTPGVECGGPLSLSGPSSVGTDGPNPRFVCRNEGDDAVSVAAGQWAVYRNGDDGWRRHATGRTGGSTALGPDEETAWVLLLDDGRGGSLTTTSTTRYVGPVPVTPGEYAFAVRGRRGGTRYEATATFTVE